MAGCSTPRQGKGAPTDLLATQLTPARRTACAWSVCALMREKVSDGLSKPLPPSECTNSSASASGTHGPQVPWQDSTACRSTSHRIKRYMDRLRTSSSIRRRALLSPSPTARRTTRCPRAYFLAAPSAMTRISSRWVCLAPCSTRAVPSSLAWTSRRRWTWSSVRHVGRPILAIRDRTLRRCACPPGTWRGTFDQITKM